METPETLRQRLDACPVGNSGWKQFEDLVVEILTFLFVPPLSPPRMQPATYSGTERRDAVFPNRNFRERNTWGQLLVELEARLILVELKNYDKTDIGKDEVNQTRNYLRNTMGRLALMIVSKDPDNGAYITRNTVFTQDKKVILFLTRDQLKEMLYMKERGQDPADLVMDLVEHFYLQHE